MVVGAHHCNHGIVIEESKLCKNNILTTLEDAQRRASSSVVARRFAEQRRAQSEWAFSSPAMASNSSPYIAVLRSKTFF